MSDEIIPMFILLAKQRLRTKRVAEMLAVIDRICREEGARLDRLFDHRPSGRWVTVIDVLANRVFREASEAEAWGDCVRRRLREELPHQKQLVKPINEMKLRMTNPCYLEMAGRGGALTAMDSEDDHAGDMQRPQDT